MPAFFEPQRQLHVLDVREERLVEPADATRHVGANEEAAPADERRRRARLALESTSSFSRRCRPSARICENAPPPYQTRFGSSKYRISGATTGAPVDSDARTSVVTHSGIDDRVVVENEQ